MNERQKNPPKRSPLARQARQILDTMRANPESPGQIEAAYRKGVHEAIAFLGSQSWRCADLEEFRERCGRAEDAARDLRTVDRDRGHGDLLLEINRRIG